MEHVPVFGKKHKSINYVPRPGAYGVLINELGLVAVIFIHGKYFLPGGGQESGESIRACLERELMEELGCEFDRAEPIGRADEYFRSLYAGKYYLGHGHYFRIFDFRIVAEPTDKTHTVEWLEPEKAVRELYHESQRWAVERALKGKGAI